MNPEDSTLKWMTILVGLAVIVVLMWLVARYVHIDGVPFQGSESYVPCEESICPIEILREY